MIVLSILVHAGNVNEIGDYLGKCMYNIEECMHSLV